MIPSCFLSGCGFIGEKLKFSDYSAQNSVDKLGAVVVAINFGDFDSFVDNYFGRKLVVMGKLPDTVAENSQIDLVDFT